MKAKFLCRLAPFLGVLLSSLFLIPSAGSKPSSDRFQPVSVKRRIEPDYPQRAYSEGISKGFARVAFYVDEKGRASDFLPVEYTHQAFAEELLAVVRKWKFVPAHFEGKPIKSVCRAYWEFLPDRPVMTDAFTDPRMRRGKSEDSVVLCEEAALDHEAMLLAFPPIEVPSETLSVAGSADSLYAVCTFFVDTEGAVNLPIIEASSNPELNGLVLDALKRSAFERPHHDGKPAVAWLRKTYKIPVYSGS